MKSLIKRDEKIYLFLLFLCINVNSINAQTSETIINELKNLFLTYDINAGVGYKNTDVDIIYNAPNITIYTKSEQKDGGGWSYTLERLFIFDILKAYYRSGFGGRSSLVIECPTGIEVESVSTTYRPFLGPSSSSDKEMPTMYSIYTNGEAINNRLINAFNNLKALAHESSVKSTPHMFDDAELSVKSITFVAPDASGKLKANQTGCIKVEIQNINSNNALEVSCVIKEKNRSELFSYEQYTSLEKIAGYETGIINIPVKASENVDNETYQFDVRVLYKGINLKTETLNIAASNPKKQRTAAVGTNGTSKNKTIRMRKMTGNTYLVSCKVNGLPLDFIFDTGASSVTLSRKQAQFMLKNGYLSKNDIIGASSYQTASGGITIGMRIKLKKIEISGLILQNVEATIINSDSAPLLLGQSALSRLGKIQIDYRNSTLTIIR